MNVKYYIKNVNNLTIPKRANESDAGYDVIATSNPNIVGDPLNGPAYRRIDYIEYETNLYIAPTGKFHTDLRPRSSISKYNLMLANSVGLIDRGYRNQVLVRFKYIWNPEDYSISGDIILGTPNLNKIYNKGDKICQLVPMETHDIDFQVMEHLDGEDRGGGFGSTDKPKPSPVINKQFVLGNRTSIDKYFAGQHSSKIEMANSYYRNYQGDIYTYEENGTKGLCVIDASGTILIKNTV